MDSRKRKQRTIRIGVDLDGVVTQNPLRAARVIVAFVKHRILKVKKLSFFVPKNKWQRTIYYWGVIAPNLWPANGTETLKEMAESNKYEFVLVTGRFSFVKKETLDWLKKYRLQHLFKAIHINEKEEQPHDFKKRLIAQYKFDYYIEDNWDIVKKLADGPKTKICWISNFLDKGRSYPYKFASLEAVLRCIQTENENSD